MLDLTAVSSIQADQTPSKCILKEALKEASFSNNLVKNHTQPTRVITYSGRYKERPYLPIIYCYEMKLPKGKKPKSSGPEVEKFTPMNINNVIYIIRYKKFRSGSNLLLIYFFI